MDYVDYMKGVKERTDREVEKLSKSEEFKRYMYGKSDPNSRYFEGKRTYDDVEEIVFSDEEEENKKNV